MLIWKVSYNIDPVPEMVTNPLIHNSLAAVRNEQLAIYDIQIGLDFGAFST